MDVYKAKIQADGRLDKLNLIIVVRGYLNNKGLIGYTCSPTASMRTFKYLLKDNIKHKSSVRQFDSILLLLQKKNKNRIFVKL